METKLTAILATLIVLMIGPIVWYCCTNVGTLPTTMDLSIQALKTYIIGRYGLAAGDWDPHSYLGRPPLVNYPMVPFLFPALLSKYFDPALACSISEYIYRIIPILTWTILELIGVSSRKSRSALAVYLLAYPIYLLYNTSYVRVATTLAYCAFTTAIIIWYSNLKRKLRTIISVTLLYISLLSNFIYILLPTLVFAIMESQMFFIPILSAAPVLYTAYEFGKLGFSNTPASCHFTFTILDPSTASLLLFLFSLSAIIFIISLIDSKIVTLSLGLGSCLIALVGYCMISPKFECLMVKLVKVLTQLDLQRLPTTLLLMLTIGVARVSRKIHIVQWIVAGIPVAGFVLVASISIPYGLYFISGNYQEDHRDLLAGTIDAILPWKYNNKLGMSLAGAFHQGFTEPALRILTAVYFPIGMMAVDYSDYIHRPGYNQIFSMELSKKLLSILPSGRMEVTIQDPGKLYGPCDVMDIKGVRSHVDPRDTVPVDEIRVLYVGSFTDYSYLWLNVVRCASTGSFPVIPCLRPYDLERRQQLNVTRYWTGDVLVVDPEALQLSNLKQLVKRAKIVVVVYSSPALDHGSLRDLIRLVEKSGKRPIVLGPVHKPLNVHDLRPLMVSVVRWDRVKVRNSVRQIANDKMIVKPQSKLAIIPWAWAPFWAVNGKEGETCPVGPYMLIRTEDKSVRLHYVAWERHQSKAYLYSILLFLSLTAAAMILSVVRRRLSGAVGLL